MRRLLIAFCFVALCGLASAQVTVISGYASNWTPGYSVYQTPGAYAAPFVPLVTTPSVSIETGLPMQIGASNATAGNVAGATNATISIVAPNMSASPGLQSAQEVVASRTESEPSTQSGPDSPACQRNRDRKLPLRPHERFLFRLLRAAPLLRTPSRFGDLRMNRPRLRATFGHREFSSPPHALPSVLPWLAG